MERLFQGLFNSDFLPRVACPRLLEALTLVLFGNVRSGTTPVSLLAFKPRTGRIPFSWQRPLRYASSAIVVALAMLLRLAMQKQLGNDLAFVTFYPALFLAAIVGGLGPGLLATVLSGATAVYFVMPGHSYAIAKPSNLIGLIVFVTTGCGISILSEWLQRAQANLDGLNRQLNRKVEEQKAAHEKNALLSSIVANSEDAIVSQTPDGIITSWNGGAQRMFGYSAPEAIGQPISMVVPPEHREQVRRNIEALLAGGGLSHFETVRLHKDGHLVCVSLSVSAILDAQGSVIGCSAVLRDIGDRKRAEEQFRMVVESAPNAMVMIDSSGRIALVNRMTEEWFGYPRAEMIGKPAEMLLPELFSGAHPEHRDGFFAQVGATQRAILPGRELRARRKDGSEFVAEVGLNPLQTVHGPMVLGAIVDVTERKRVEQNIREFNRMLESQVSRRTAELRSANKELEEFAYAASHDLKAPLRVIDNCSKWLEEDLQPHLSGETLENMTLLRGRVHRMEKLLDDLLEYARIGRVKDSGQGETVDGGRLMQTIVDLLPRSAIAIQVGPGFERIRVRVMPLQQILLNLIGNAIKHHDKKQGLVEVTVEDTGSQYVFAVKDDGPGIPPQFHGQIFKMFQTLRPRDQVEGSGMGLAIVRKHMEIAGGTIEVISTEGQGSTFRFTWPKLQTLAREVGQT